MYLLIASAMDRRMDTVHSDYQSILLATWLAKRTLETHVNVSLGVTPVRDESSRYLLISN